MASKFEKKALLIVILFILSGAGWIVFSRSIAFRPSEAVYTNLYERVDAYLRKYDLTIYRSDTLNRILYLDFINRYTLSVVILNINQKDSVISVRCMFPDFLDRSTSQRIAFALMIENFHYDDAGFAIDTTPEGDVLFFQYYFSVKQANFADSSIIKECLYPMGLLERRMPFIWRIIGVSLADPNHYSLPENS